MSSSSCTKLGASHAWSAEKVFGIPHGSIVKPCDVFKVTREGPKAHRSNFVYNARAISSAVDVD